MKIITAQDLHVNRPTLHIKYFRKNTSPFLKKKKKRGKNTSPNFQAQAVCLTLMPSSQTLGHLSPTDLRVCLWLLAMHTKKEKAHVHDL